MTYTPWRNYATSTAKNKRLRVACGADNDFSLHTRDTPRPGLDWTDIPDLDELIRTAKDTIKPLLKMEIPGHYSEAGMFKGVLYSAGERAHMEHGMKRDPPQPRYIPTQATELLSQDQMWWPQGQLAGKTSKSCSKKRLYMSREGDEIELTINQCGRRARN